jgi:hypothetical protein
MLTLRVSNVCSFASSTNKDALPSEEIERGNQSSSSVLESKSWRSMIMDVVINQGVTNPSGRMRVVNIVMREGLVSSEEGLGGSGEPQS